jgi:hypothetical protein
MATNASQQLAVLALKALLARGLGDTRRGVIAGTSRHRDPLYGEKKLAKTKLAAITTVLDTVCT